LYSPEGASEISAYTNENTVGIRFNLFNRGLAHAYHVRVGLHIFDKWRRSEPIPSLGPNEGCQVSIEFNKDDVPKRVDREFDGSLGFTDRAGMYSLRFVILLEGSTNGYLSAEIVKGVPLLTPPALSAWQHTHEGKEGKSSKQIDSPESG
jgi:hypothetical protein